MNATSIVEHVIYEQFGKGNFSKYEQCIAPDVQCHFPPSWNQFHQINNHNRQEARKLDDHWASAFQFRKTEITDLIAADHTIFVRWRAEGTNKGDFFNLKATHKPIELAGQTTYQFNQKEQIAVAWQSWDMLGFIQQLKYPTQDAQKLGLLSPQEKRCLQHLLEGKTAKETALAMHISFRTVEYYFENIKDKLSCFHKKDLLPYARFLVPY